MKYIHQIIISTEWDSQGWQFFFFAYLYFLNFCTKYDFVGSQIVFKKTFLSRISRLGNPLDVGKERKVTVGVNHNAGVLSLGG